MLYEITDEVDVNFIFFKRRKMRNGIEETMR